MAIKTHIEAHTNMLLQAADAELKKGCDEIFVRIFHNFDLVCLKQEGHRFQASNRGKELRADIEKAKQVLQGLAREALLSADIRVDLV